MRISLFREKLSVVTESGKDLGKLRDAILDTDSHGVVQYVVGGFLHQELRVAPEQVVRFEEGKMVVKDTVTKVDTEEEKVEVSGQTEPVMMREESES